MWQTASTGQDSVPTEWHVITTQHKTHITELNKCKNMTKNTSAIGAKSAKRWQNRENIEQQTNRVPSEYYSPQWKEPGISGVLNKVAPTVMQIIETLSSLTKPTQSCEVVNTVLIHTH